MSKNQDSDKSSCKRLCSQEQSPDDALRQSNDHIIYGSDRVIAKENLSRVSSVSTNDILTQEDHQILADNTVVNGCAKTPHVFCQASINSTLISKRGKIARDSAIVSEHSEVELSKECSVSPHDDFKEEKGNVLHDNTVVSTSANTAPVLCQGSLNGTFKQESVHIAHSSGITSETLETELSQVYGLSPRDVLIQEEVQVLLDNTVASIGANTAPVLCQGPLNSTLTQEIQPKAISNDNLEAELSKVCVVSTNDNLRQENDQLFYSNAVASTSADSVWNKDPISNITPIKTSKSATNKSEQYILHTIDQYDKHLRTSGALKGILKDDSLNLLSTWANVIESAKKIVCHLYCIDREEQPNKLKIEDLEIEEIEKSLSAKGFIILVSEGSIHQLNSSDLKDICKILKLKSSPRKEENKEKISQHMNSTNIGDWFEGSNKPNICKRYSEELEAILKNKWKLSELARETINELLILMHLDNIFKMGCSLDPAERTDDRPAIKFKPPVTQKCYPVDEKMIVDNASLIFQNRQEFCRYLEAYAFYKKYKTTADTKSKWDIVLNAYKLYTEITRNDNLMLRNWKLPMWLRRFTPAHLYVEILEDGVIHLEKSQPKIEKAVEVLDSLISQLTFRQHKKAEWYDMKYNIQRNYLKSENEAACTIKEACEANLPEETVNTLRDRAKQIVNQKKRMKVDQNILEALRVHANKIILENSIPGPDYFYKQPIMKTNSRNRPKYMWEGETVSAEVYCCNIFKQRDRLKIGEHWEGRIVTTIYFLLFWDIIYTKPLGVTGIFMSHYQLYPLDMWCESFYINRKAWIDNYLTVIEKSTSDEIVAKMLKRWEDSAKYDVPDIVRSIKWDYIETVVRLLGPQALAAICRRLAQNYEYTRLGFPDLTLCHTDSIKFREVKTDNDIAHAHQMQWLLYLIKHNIDASICYLHDNTEQQPRENNSESSNSEAKSEQSQADRTDESLDNSK